jgi:hypothetical protein
MAMAAGAEPRRYDRAWWRARLRRAAPLIALLAVAIVVAVIVTPRADSGLPLDPSSTRPDGTRALVDVLRGVGREVSVVTPDEMSDDAPVVLLLRDQLDPPQRAALERRIEQGARVVVADETSPLVPEVVGLLSPLERRLERGCPAEAVRDAGAVRPGGGALYEVPDAAQGCFRSSGSGEDEDAAWLVVQPRGRGHVVALGSPAILANWGLEQADNAVLAVHLLTPDDSDRTEIVRPVLRAAEGGGDLFALIPDRVRAALWQVLIGFLVVIAWRARRLGAPLIERAPVKLASSDLTAAVGVLLGRNDARAATQARIVDDTRQRLARRIGLPAAADVDMLIQQLAARTSLDATELARVLQPPPPPTDDALLRATAALADVEQTVHAQLTSTLEETDVR